MHNAPPVAFPVGRFVWARALWGGALLLSAAGLSAWQWQSQATSTMVWSAWVFVVVCAGITAFAAPRQILSDGRLLWSGENWGWQSGLGNAEDDEVGDGEAWALSVGLDLGSCMALILQRPPNAHRNRGPCLFAWVSERDMPSKWHGFRCAVYSRPQTLKPSHGATL
jgi:hypothetical protein